MVRNGLKIETNKFESHACYTGPVLTRSMKFCSSKTFLFLFVFSFHLIGLKVNPQAGTFKASSETPNSTSKSFWPSLPQFHSTLRFLSREVQACRSAFRPVPNTAINCTAPTVAANQHPPQPILDM